MAAIAVKNLKKYYEVQKKEPGFKGALKALVKRKVETVKAVDDISFEIGGGELVGFIGPNGAGKTTTLKVLSGLLFPTGGEVSVLGFTPWQRKPAFQEQMTLIMGQKNQLWWDLPATETFLLNKEIYEIPPKDYERRLGELSEMLELKDLLNVPVRKLSLGQRMKCELVASLLHQPKIVFLDEPSIGLDVVMQARMRQFIKDYNQRYQATIILTSHYMGDVKELCRRVIIIDNGKIIYDGLLAQLAEKYATDKHMTLTLSEEVESNKLSEIAAPGKVTRYEYPQAVIEVPRLETSRLAAEVLQKLPVADLNIEDIPIEEVVRQIFQER